MRGRRITSSYNIAIVWRGDREARQHATPQNNRFHRVFEELAALGIDAEPAVYDEEFADEVRAQLLAVDGVLVWVDPIHQGKTRAALDPLLRDVAARGPWVSAHPDVILKMGVKEVLYRTQASRLGHRHASLSAARRHFARRSRCGCGGRPPRPEAEPRQRRPGGLEGRAGLPAARRAMVRVLHAQRGSVPEEMPLGGLHGAAARPISAGAAASSTSRFSRVCPMA